MTLAAFSDPRAAATHLHLTLNISARRIFLQLGCSGFFEQKCRDKSVMIESAFPGGPEPDVRLEARTNKDRSCCSPPATCLSRRPQSQTSPTDPPRANLRQVSRINGSVMSATLPAFHFLTGGVFGVKCLIFQPRSFYLKEHFFLSLCFFFLNGRDHSLANRSFLPQLTSPSRFSITGSRLRSYNMPTEL